jgi:mRNA interferase MazF
MSREALIKKTIQSLDKLPDHRVKEVSDFAEFLLSKIENQILTEGIQKLAANSKSYQFLEDDPDLYSVKKGDVVLVPFPFTDLSGSKNRPALVLVVTENDVTVAFITSQMKWLEELDVKIEPAFENGLKQSSLIRIGKLTTLDKNMVIGKLGSIGINELQIVNQNLIQIFKLNPPDTE